MAPKGGLVDDHSSKSEDVLGLQDLDPALNRKMHLVNNAIEELGWTRYHTKLFFLNGFRHVYAVDSLVLLLQSVVAGPAFREFGRVGYEKGLTVSAYVGMLIGALVWGFGADIIGRRLAFNVTLLICSAATIIAGGMPNWASLGFFVACIGLGAGGNLILDTTVFLEYLPGSKQWALILMAAWWGLGQAIMGFIAWGFLVPEKWNCASVETCTKYSNMGWRYVMFTSGAIVLVMSILRVTVIRLKETPKYLLGVGEDAKVVETLQFLATKHGRSCSLTLEKLDACGVVTGAHSRKRFSLDETLIHLRGLFATPKISTSTLLVWVSWAMVGLAYPLFYVFLPSYLASCGANLNVSSFDSWRNYALTNISSIFGPILAAWMCETPILGRKYTMVIGALVTAAFFFAYTAVRTGSQDVGFSCAIGFCLNVYYSTLYAYTPEVLPSAHRATGNGVAVACSRTMGIISSVIATASDTSTTAPIFICGALLVAMSVVSTAFPFEPYGRRSS
ncbi:major facilitator superfamily domain-containing protein [Lasiosphaeria miniovina]|uniref:Major facilitator superfamily domain-containing protein n=1 Tax=Lasiosphaeria miniovina TaxID=1954250 RepID=A0AA39ZYM9_9PEZI|nr:major facilitator superfamily domain-containing protein [Lasiosphaeria miniovina]KAK0706066.1 major facilitator superfamily domain-containing protein [Lasiosphaeria miniovina]